MVVVTCLSNVAAQVGAGRIMSGGKFHYPTGRPELPASEELRWRVALVEKALASLETHVEETKIF